MKIAFRIVSIFAILVITSTIVFWLYVASFGDSSVELKRGNILDEILLSSSPLRQFPENAIIGKYRFFYSSGEASVGSSNGLIIEMPEFRYESLDKCVKWLGSVLKPPNKEKKGCTPEEPRQ